MHNLVIYRHRILLLLLLIGSSVWVRAASAVTDSVIAVHAGENGAVRTGKAAVWHDPEAEDSIEQVWQHYQNGEFKALQTRDSTGLKRGAFWSYFALNNPSADTLRLHLEYIDHQLIHLSAYQRPQSEHTQFEEIADLSMLKPFDSRPVPHNRFVVEVVIPPYETHDFLINYRSDEAGFVTPSMRIWSPKQLRASQAIETNAIAFLFGGFFLMCIFALVAGIATNESAFYTYSVYSFSKIVVWATVLGYTHQYLIKENFHWSYISSTGAFSIMCGLVFARAFLQTGKYTPKLDYVLFFMMANAVFMCACGLLKQAELTVISITFALLLYPMLLLVAYQRWRQGSLEAGVFGLAWVLLVVGLVVQALRDMGFVPNNMLNYYWPPYASFVEMLTIMAAIGLKVRRLRQQKEQAEQRYTHQLEKSKAELEEEVRERTKALVEAKQLAEKEARTDALTGIHNRRSFFCEATLLITMARRKQHPLSLLLFDIDHFKNINDQFGHACGDKALKAFTDTILENIRAHDIFGRLGGEEFAVLLYEEREGAVELAQRLRHFVKKINIVTENSGFTFTTSIGVSYWQNQDDIEALLHKADNALYAAKNAGRDQVCVFNNDTTTETSAEYNL